MQSMSEDLKKIRMMNSITQEELAEFMGVSQSYISRLEHGKEKPSKTFIRLFSIKFLNELNENSIGARIRNIRENNNMDIVNFSNMLGIECIELRKIETNVIIPNDTLIKLIAISFKSNEHWLKTGDL